MRFFIVGSARSGTTLLRRILNSHSHICIPPESRFIVDLYGGTDTVRVDDFLNALRAHKHWPFWDIPIDEVRAQMQEGPTISYADAIEAVYRTFATTRGKSIWGDKTPRYIEHIPLLAGLFPEALFLHVIRDGRNVALSYADVPFGPKTIPKAAALWARRVAKGLDEGRSLGPGRYLELRYEDFVESPEVHLRRICDFLDVGFEEGMLDPDSRARREILDRAKLYNPHVGSGPTPGIRDFRAQMSAKQIEAFESVAGDVLSALGYERCFPAPSLPVKAMGALGRLGVPLFRLRHRVTEKVEG